MTEIPTSNFDDPPPSYDSLMCTTTGCGLLPYPTGPPPYTIKPAIVQQPVNTPLDQGLRYTSGPAALESLTLNQLMVERTTNRAEEFSTFPIDENYYIRNSFGQDVFYAVDITHSDYSRSAVPFKMQVFDKFKTDVIIHLHRPVDSDLYCSIHTKNLR